MIDLTPIVEAIVALVAAIITAFVIPWLKGKIDADKLEEIELWVTVAVEAAVFNLPEYIGMIEAGGEPDTD